MVESKCDPVLKNLPRLIDFDVSEKVAAKYLGSVREEV